VQSIRRNEAQGPCPHLGLVDDPDTGALYPRTDHRCFLPGTSNAAPDTAWQERYCLSGRHDQCPLLRASVAGEKLPGASSRRWVWASAAALIVVLLLAGSAFTLKLGSNRIGLDRPTSANGAEHTPAAGLVASPTPMASAATVSSTSIVTAEPTLAPTATTTATVASTSTPVPTETASPTSTASPSPTSGPPTPTPTAVAASPTANPATPTTGPTTHVVEAGETLSDIAAEYGVTVQAIIDLNHIDNPNVIYAGTVLQIPAP
jgi:LysM repeat protein